MSASIAGLAVVLAGLALGAVSASATTFSNTASIGLRDPNFTGNPNCSNPGTLCNATAATYPSTIAVSGLSGTVNGVSLSLNNVSYSFSNDIDALLVGPGGQSLIVVAAVGPNTGASVAASNSTLTISDSGTLPTDLTPWGSAPNFKPANFGSFGLGSSVNGFNETYTSPAPAAPWGDPGQHGTNATLGSIFNGTSPNGTWSLYVITTSAGDGTGAIAGGWTLNVTTASVAGTTTALASNNNPSFTTAPGNSVTLTATVHKASDASNVSEGTVAFTDGGTTISGCGAVALSAGTAACTTTFATEGNHSLLASYSGTANFGPSSNGLTQTANDHTAVSGSDFCNGGSIALNNPAATLADATPYPSNLFVSGLSGTVNGVTVTLKNATYSHSQDIDVLLVDPNGHTLILVANLGPNSGAGAPASNATLTFSDAGVLPSSGMGTAWSSLTTIKPVNYGGFNEIWGPPAPVGPYGDPGTAGTAATLASQFNGLNGNGTWSLYVITTAAGDGTGAIAGGWCAHITAAAVAGTTTTLTSNNNPSFTSSPGNTVTLTAAVTKTSDSSNVGEGTVNFTDGGSAISGCTGVAVTAGQAACTTSFTTEGTHPILAQYSGSANFGPSNSSLSQLANDHTTVTGSSFCNTGTVALNNPPVTLANATPYPSNVFITGRPGPLQHLTVTLNGVTYSHSQDIDVLLVGPGGQTLILVAAAGPNTGGALGNVTLKLDDSAAAQLSGTVAWGAPNATVTARPANYGGLNELWGPPAPAGPYGNPGPFGGGTATLGSIFNGTVPNGTWSLYAITTAAGDGTGAIAGGWCLGVTSPQPPTLTKAFGAPTIPQGGSTSLSFTVANPNASSSLTGVGFTDTLPAGLAVATPSGLTGTCGGGTITATAGSGSVSLSGATLASSASCTFSVNVTASSPGSMVNTTSAPTSAEGGSGSAATATLVVVAPPSLTKAFGAASVVVGGSTSLTFTVTNPNAANSLSGVGFTDTLPSGLVVSTPNGLTGSCGGGTITAAAGSGSVSLAGATLAGGGVCIFAVNVTGTSVGSQVNTTSTIASTEGGPGAAATATVTVTPSPPQISKAFSAATVPLNGPTTLTFTLSNPNAGMALLTGVGFTDTLPAGLVVATPTGASATCTGTATATAGSGSVSLSGALLAAGSSCTLSVNVTGTTAGVKNNSVTVSSTNGGTGNTANASLTVVAPPSLTKSFTAASVPLNGTTMLTLTAGNPNATVSLSGVGYIDTLPAGLVVATPNNLSQTCGGTISAVPGSSLVSLSGAPLAATASCTISLNVTGTTAGAKVNTTSTISSTEGGSGAAATASLAVLAPPQFAKLFGASSVALNGTTSLTFSITNPNASGSLSGVGFTDTFPAGLVVATPNGLSGSCGGGTITATAGSGSVGLAGATLAPSATCSFSVNVTGTSSGTKVNTTSTVSSNEGGSGSAATATLSVAGPPQITKAFGAATVPLGGTTSLSFTVTNPAANGPETGIAFTDTLPAGLAVATPNGLSGSCGGGAITATGGSTPVSLSGAALAAGATCTFSVNVTGVAAGVANNSVTVSSTEGGSGNTANASLTVVAPPSLIKAFGAATVPLGGTTALTFTATNPNATVALSGVGFSDTLPAGLAVATPNGLSGSCGGGTITAAAGSSQIALGGATLAPGATCTFSVNVIGNSPGAQANTTSTISSVEGGSGAAATATLTVLAPPQIQKAFGASTVALNGTTTLTFTIANPNAGTALAGVGFTDTLPAGLVVATPNGLSGACGGGTITAVAGSGTVTLAGAAIAGGGTCTFALNVTATTTGTKMNSVTVSSTNGGTGNTATASITTALPPVIAKAFGAPTIPQNGATSLTFTVSNPAANVTLSGISFTDTFPAGLVVTTPNGLSGSCGGGTITATAGAGTVSLAGATLASGASCSFAVNVTGTTPGTLSNSVSVTATESGPGNTAMASIIVVAPPTIAKSFGASSIPLGSSTSLRFTVSNPAGNQPLTGVGFTDALPAGLVVASPNGLAGSCGGGTITATAGSGSVSLAGAALAAGSSCTFSVNVTGTTAGTKTNSVSATSTNGGSGNTAIASIVVVAPPTISKAFGAPSIVFGATTSLSFTVANPNTTATLSGVGFTDTLPAGLVVATPNGLSGSCGGGTIAATAGSGAVSLAGATLAAGASCTFAVNVTAVAVGQQSNTTSTVSSTQGGSGAAATASVSVAKAPTTVTVTAVPPSSSFGAPVTITATVAPAQANGSGVGPTGTVRFFLDGASTPIATLRLAGGQASFTTSALGAGTHHIVAVYSGDQNFLGSTSAPPTPVTVTCATTITGFHSGTLFLGTGSTCFAAGAHITGAVIAPAGANVDLEGATIDGSITAQNPASFRLCGSTVGGQVSVSGATGFVVVGDPGKNACASNTIAGGLSLKNNTGGLVAIGNHVTGAVIASGNSGNGPFPGDGGPVVSGNGP